MKNKKSLIAIVLIAIIGVVGVTFAYFSNTTTIENVFKTKPYSTEAYEEFVSPENWTPGTTTDKKVYVTNNGSVNVAVRMSYTESWVSADGTTLSGVQDDNQAAIINFANTTDWTYNPEGYEEGYYYYNTDLAPNATTSSFIESVTFNSAIVSEATCTTDEDTKTTNCVSTGKGYDGATYTLTIKVETLQADAKDEVWGVQ